MRCGKCGKPVVIPGVGSLPEVLNNPVIIESNYLNALVCSGCQKKPKECSCEKHG